MSVTVTLTGLGDSVEIALKGTVYCARTNKNETAAVTIAASSKPIVAMLGGILAARSFARNGRVEVRKVDRSVLNPIYDNSYVISE